MPVALIVASLFIVIGSVLVRTAWQSLTTGAAETDENGTLYKERQPVRYWLFVVTQLVFGAFAVIVGITLLVLSTTGQMG